MNYNPYDSPLQKAVAEAIQKALPDVPIYGLPEPPPRDTHFANFAKLLWEEMLSQTQWLGIDVTAGHIPLHHPEDEEHQQYIQIIARRAYDLVCHALSHETPSSFEMFETPEPIISEDIPDMTSFPEQPQL